MVGAGPEEEGKQTAGWDKTASKYFTCLLSLSIPACKQTTVRNRLSSSHPGPPQPPCRCKGDRTSQAPASLGCLKFRLFAPSNATDLPPLQRWWPGVIIPAGKCLVPARWPASTPARCLFGTVNSWKMLNSALRRSVEGEKEDFYNWSGNEYWLKKSFINHTPWVYTRR